MRRFSWSLAAVAGLAIMGYSNWAMTEDPDSLEPPGHERSAAQSALEVKPILDHNRAWLHPEYNRLKSVSFSHASGPKRLVEAFDWRSDGTSLLEILEYPDRKESVGRRELSMPDGSFYSYVSENKYPQHKAAPDEGSERYVREHLRGVRMNFAALDWGAEPEQFAIRKVSPNDDGTLSVTLAPRQTPYRINVGVMFHYTSWAYLHDVNIALAELRIDPASHRILREADYTAEGERLAEIEFRDWKSVAEDREVPLQIHVLVEDKHQFDVDYRFQWREEGLWILKSSTGAFDGKDPQRGEILDLAVNRPTPRLDRAVDNFKQSNAALQEPASANKRITLQGLNPFELGKTIALQEIAPEKFPTAKNLLLAFDLSDTSSQYNHYVELTAELDLERFDAAKMGDRQLLLTFLDREGLPIQAHYASLAAVPASGLTPQKIAENLCKHNALWLSPLRSDKFSYVYRRDSTTKQVAVDERSSASDRQGFTLSTSFEDLLRAPETYRVPVQFEGMLDGKPVVFAGFCGKSLNHECGNGLSGIGWQGYMSYLNSTGLVVFEKETWRPLVVRVGYLEIQYRDYVEVEPGVSVPLRIVVASDKGAMRSDFRYKILDGKLWLFDRSYQDGKVVTSTEEVLWADGKAATATARSTEEGIPLKELKAFDFSRITDRRVADAQESAVLRGVMGQSRPWEYPGYADLMKTALSVDKNGGTTKLCMNLGPAEHLKDAGFFALTWLSPDHAFAAIPGPRQAEVNAYSLPPGKIAKIKMPEGASLGELSHTAGLLSAELKKEQAGYEAKVEFLDATQYKGLIATLSLAIANPQGVILSAGSRNQQFANYQGIHSAEELLHLGSVADTQPLYLITRYHTEVYARMMGSALGTASEPYKPPLAWDQILSAEDSRVWGYGLQLLQGAVNYELGRYAGWDFPANQLENYLHDQIVSPHKDALARLLKTVKEPKYLAILAQLAGHTGEPRFRELLLPLLEHPDKDVRAAAAIHLCRLGDARGLKLVLEVFQQELQGIPESTGYSPIAPRLVEAFMAMYAVDTDEVISTLGDAFLIWVKKPFGDRSSYDADQNGIQAAFKLMLGILGHSKRPQAVDYLCRALRGETRSAVQDTILAQLHPHENKEEVLKAIIAGLEAGNAEYFKRAWQRPEIGEVVAKKLLDPELKADAFSAAVAYLAFDEETYAYDALRQAYEKKLHADDSELRSAVICGLAHHGDDKHLPEAFDLLVKAVGEPLPASADKQAEYKRKRRIDQIGSRDYGIARYFPPEVVAEFLHGKDAEKQPAVREAVKFL